VIQHVCWRHPASHPIWGDALARSAFTGSGATAPDDGARRRPRPPALPIGPTCSVVINDVASTSLTDSPVKARIEHWWSRLNVAGRRVDRGIRFTALTLIEN